MKITFVTSFLTVFGGGGKFLRDYANKFCENGHDITIVAQKIDHKNYKFIEGISLIEIGGRLQTHPLHWIRFNKIKKKYLEVLKRLNSDLYISLHFPSNYICYSLNKIKKIKHVYYCFEPFRAFHDKNFISNAPFAKRIIFLLLKFFFKKYDIQGSLATNEIICISNFIKKRVKECYNKEGILHYIGIKKNEEPLKLDYIPYKVKSKFQKNIPIIFTLGLTHHMKGIRELTYIFKKILNVIPETLLLIGGWIKKENEILIKNMIRKLKIPKNNIEFTGFIENDHVKDFYKISILTFYTAIDESFGLIPLESMMTGTPVIAFDGAGPSETIINEKTGYLINNYNLDDFAQKAINLIRDHNLYEKLSKNAKEYVLTNFSFEESSLKLEKILKKIISKN